MSKKIMILGAGILQLPAIEKALEMGLQVVAVDMNPNAVGMKVAGVVPEVVSTIDIPGAVAVAKKHRIDGVMTLATDMPMRTVAAVSKELGLVGITDETALKATNKAIMRQALAEANVPIPAFYKVSNAEEYEAAVKHFTGDFIVKPADNSGSRGIYKLNAADAEDTVKAAYGYSKNHSRNGDVVVEEFMRGEEISVETLSVDGVCHVVQITDKLTTGAPHFVEMGHSQPTHHSPEMIDRIKAAAIAATHAVGIVNGASHTEIMVTSEGPKIVELGARLGGDCITTHLVPLSTGVNMVENCIRIALGEKPEITPAWSCGSAIRYFKSDVGRIEEINGLDEAEGLPGVKQVSVVHGVGECAKEIRSSNDRVGFVIAQGKTAEEAIQICEEAMRRIHVQVTNQG